MSFTDTSCRSLWACASCTAAGWPSVPIGCSAVPTWTRPAGSTCGSTWSSLTDSGSWSRVCCWSSPGYLWGHCTCSDWSTTETGRRCRTTKFVSTDQLNVFDPVIDPIITLISLVTSYIFKGTFHIFSKLLHDKHSCDWSSIYCIDLCTKPIKRM